MAKTDSYNDLVAQLTAELQETGRASMPTLKGLEACRGTRRRPYAFLAEWDYLPYKADTQATPFEQERRGLSAQGIIEPNEYDKRNAQAQAENARKQEVELANFKKRLQEDTQGRRKVILPLDVRALTV